MRSGRCLARAHTNTVCVCPVRVCLACQSSAVLQALRWPQTKLWGTQSVCWRRPAPAPQGWRQSSPLTSSPMACAKWPIWWAQHRYTAAQELVMMWFFFFLLRSSLSPFSWANILVFSFILRINLDICRLWIKVAACVCRNKELIQMGQLVLK